MRTAMSRSSLTHHVMTLILGALLALAIWLVGNHEQTWLGFVIAAIYAETARGQRALAALPRRPRS